MKWKVLVIDDEEIVRNVLNRALTLQGCSVQVTGDSRLALDILHKETFDIVICDLRMPEVPGTEIIKQVREISPKTLVIVITGSVSDEAQKIISEMKIKYCLIKPFGINELFKIINEELGNS